MGFVRKFARVILFRIITHKGDDKRKKIDSYAINLGRCIYCGLCAEVCPELAIVMGDRFENASLARAQYAGKHELLRPIDEAKTHTQLEFAGFGSVSAQADKSLRPTPIAWDKPISLESTFEKVDSSAETGRSRKTPSKEMCNV